MSEIPRVRQSNKGQASIDDYFQDTITIWIRDREESSVFDLSENIYAHTSHVVKNVRRNQPEYVIDSIADTTMYLLSLLAQCHHSNNELDRPFHIDTNPSDIIWNKYPGMCPTCFDSRVTDALYSKEEVRHKPRQLTTCDFYAIDSCLIKWVQEYSDPMPCICLSKGTFPEGRHQPLHKGTNYLDTLRVKYAQLLRASGHKPSSMLELEDMFTKIFQNTYSSFSLENTTSYLQEEVGEMAEALKDCYKYDTPVEPWYPEVEQRNLKLQDEIADVFSCLFVTFLKIKSWCIEAEEYISKLSADSLSTNTTVSEAMTFSELIWSKYGRSKKSGEVWEYMKCPKCESRPCTCVRYSLIPWGRLKSEGQNSILDTQMKHRVEFE
jgi:NTP pyrophosphatase (non-canonical NTP hydrolase)